MGDDKKKEGADQAPEKIKIPPGYQLSTQLIHGQFSTSAWDFSHHLNPPESASTTFRLKSLERG
ncbi:MAG: hypothetical protein KDD43_12800, partial [Bdellovibrionales bacterium]|nr:hypothetical protein [Bdellovibrionales bacterium]